MATGKWKLWLKSLVLLCCPFCAQVFAQDVPRIQPASFLRANDRFSMELLETAHEQEQDRNIVIAPLPVSLTLATLWDATTNPESKTELAATLRWENGSGIRLAVRMLLTRFGKPAPYPRSLIPKDSFARTYLRQFQSGKPEELWISGAHQSRWNFGRRCAKNRNCRG
jgi:Serpin (serine protease inhibitor)